MSAGQIVVLCFTAIVIAPIDNVDIPMWSFSLPGRGTLLKFSGARDETASGRLSHRTKPTLLGPAGPRLRRALWLFGERDPPRDQAVPGLQPRRKTWTVAVAGKGDAL